jgi:lipopolysaccharide transport system ATP-binding protein
MNDTVISVRNVSKCYKVFETPKAQLLHALWPKNQANIQEVWALKDINFNIKRGEAVSIIGRNGGGKSTLLEIITGTLTPTSGEVKVNGRVSALLELGSGFNPEYTGRDNVILNGLLLGLSRNEILARFNEITDFAEIGDALNRPVKTYSSGMVMRLAFAVQVLCEPDILIIDEALSVGDFFFQQKCLGHIRELCKKGMTLLFVSHDMGTVRDICNRTIYLRKGEKHFEGETIDAIRKYISEKNNPIEPEKPTQAISMTAPSKKENSKATILKDAIWSAEETWDEKEPGRLLAIAIYDSNDHSMSSCSIGETMKIVVAYQIKPKIEADITVGLKNKFDQYCTVTGSRHLNKVPPQTNDPNEILVFSLSMEMLLEAGNYSVVITLGKSTKPNSGSRIDQAPPLGPITVTWDYGNETAPFLGQVGLPTSCEFEFY